MENERVIETNKSNTKRLTPELYHELQTEVSSTVSDEGARIISLEEEIRSGYESRRILEEQIQSIEEKINSIDNHISVCESEIKESQRSIKVSTAFLTKLNRAMNKVMSANKSAQVDAERKKVKVYRRK